MTTQHFEADLIVVGSGAGGLTTALVAAVEGLDVVVIESSRKIGGTTAISGGMVWVPGNQFAAASGTPDSRARIDRYLEQVVPDYRADPRMTAFVEDGPRAIEYLTSRTAVQLQPVTRYPDYYPDLEGATLGGRVLEPVPFDGSLLGGAFRDLREPLPEFTLFGGMMVARPDIPAFRKVFKSAPATWRVGTLIANYARQRLRHHRGTSLVLGNALAARLYYAGRQAGVRFLLNARVERLIQEHGRCAGVELDHGSPQVRARYGVVLATGGFSHDAQLKAKMIPHAENHVSATIDGADGSGYRLARSANAALSGDGQDAAFWAPVSRYRTPGGRDVIYPHTVTDRAKPGIIAVDGSGCRFVNECVSYHEFGRAMERAHNSGLERFYLLADADAIWKYGLGAIKPFTIRLRRYIRAGYLRRAPSVAELAAQLGLDARALVNTIDTYNAGAVHGVDSEFGRGSDAYQRHLGDADVTPNPNVAPLLKPPFYGIRLLKGDLGTAAGLATDADARVLNEHGAPISGLYAVGNDAYSIMHGSYPGPGITLGPALVFGYRAAMAIKRQSVDGNADYTTSAPPSI